MGHNVKGRLEPVERCFRGGYFLSHEGGGIASAVNRFCPKDVRRREVVGIEIEDKICSVERDIKLDHVGARGVEDGLSVGHVHLGILWNFMVELQLHDPFIGDVSKIQREFSKHAVDHQPSIEVIAQQSPVGHDQLSPFLDGDGRTRFHRDVGIDGQGGTRSHDDMAVHGRILRPRFVLVDVACLTSGRG